MKIFSTLVLLGSVTFAQAQLIDPGFEYGPLDSPWAQESTTFGTPFCNVVDCGVCGGECGPQAGTWFVWFGGQEPGNEEAGVVSQVITIPDGNQASLSFYVKVATVGDSTTTERVDVSLDGNVLFQIDATERPAYSDYVQETLDIDNLADGAQHTITVAGNSLSGSSILFDSFALVVDGEELVGVNEQLNGESGISFYPNPVDQLFTIRFANEMEGAADVKIFDNAGKLVDQTNFSNVFNSSFNLNTTNFANGIYTVVVNHNNKNYSNRFVVNH
jgi:hypothetical protein